MDAAARRRDERFLRRALALAARGRFTVAPNPRVGAVVVRGERVVGEGFHRQAGGPHAEIEALRASGAAARGATLYVNLEPCNHHGRTPPCSIAVISAGIARVAYCHRDPNPAASGGSRFLAEAGIEVLSGLELERALELNLPFLVSHVDQRPAVTLKWAMSLDGKIATAGGQSQWISSPQGRRWALELREEHDAILVGSGTIVSDDPRLDRRLGKAPGAIVRVVLDRRLRLRSDARLLQVEGQVLLYTEQRERAPSVERLRAVGAVVVCLERVSPETVLTDLGRRGISSVLVEGGGEVLAAFARTGRFDRVAVCCAPMLIGGRAAPSPLGGDGFGALGDSPRLERTRVRRRGPDLIIEGIRAGCLQDLSRSVAD